jgi:hypothetical protein
MNKSIIPKDHDILCMDDPILRSPKIDIKPYSHHRYFLSFDKKIMPNSYFDEPDIKKIYLEKIYKKN